MRGDAETMLDVRWLDRISYAEALALQEKLVAEKIGQSDAPDRLLLLEHDPVYTIGRTPDKSSLLGQTHLPFPLFETNRGGQATYHGPGQLVGYPILDLRRCGQDLHKYLRWLEDLLIEFLGQFGIQASRRPGLTGVWVESSGSKIASIGIGVKHWITMHGFALNVGGDLSPFRHITPCGIQGVNMTSITAESGRWISVVEVAGEFENLVLTRMARLQCQLASAI